MGKWQVVTGEYISIKEMAERSKGGMSGMSKVML
jgi:hypothetical protein